MVIIIVLILINGILAMAEIAIVSSKKYRLEKLAGEGKANARMALDLANNPGRFLSTVQVGITFVGIFAGAFGESTFRRELAVFLGTFAVPFADAVSLAFVVLAVGYAFLIFGELVPKRIALAYPETISLLTAPFMKSLAQAAYPLVAFLSLSTDAVLKFFPIKKPQDLGVTEEEVRMLIREGTVTGVFDISEQDIVERTLRLGDKKVSEIMTPAKEIVFFHEDAKKDAITKTVTKHPYSHFPVVRKGIHDAVGIVRTKVLLMHLVSDEADALKKSMLKPLVIHEAFPALKALEMFRKTKLHVALIVDEYGAVQGLITLTDILEAIVGDIPSITEPEETDIVKRSDGTYLVNGLMNIEDFFEFFQLPKISGDKGADFHTVGGFVIRKMEKIPVSGDSFYWEAHRFEVVDMDGNRVDKVLVSKP